MAWGFLDWVRGRRRPRGGAKGLALRPNASTAELREIASLLLSTGDSYNAFKLLDAQKERARPVLEALYRDDARFRGVDFVVRDWHQPPIGVTLKILMRWGSEFAVAELTGLATAPDARLRAVAGRFLASMGQARFIRLLTELAADADEAVRTALGHGLGDAEQGKDGFRLEGELALALYDFMLTCIRRTDRGPSGAFPAMLRVARDRAIADLTADATLQADRNFLSKIIPTLADAGVRVPREKVEALLVDVLARLERGAYDKWDFPVSRIRELLLALDAHDRSAACERMRALGRHPHPKAREAAQEVRERLFGSPIEYARDQCFAAGGPENARAEHRVVCLVTDLGDEVCNGGWLQWVANSTGATAGQTLDALQEISADQAAGELRKVMEALGPDGSSPNQRKRMKAIDKLMKAGRTLPEEDVMWALSWDLRALCYDYAERHPDAFPPEAMGRT